MTSSAIADFQLLALLGRGGMGEVYRARHRPTGRLVALKLLRADRMDEDGKSIQRLKAEIQAMRSLKHPHLIQFFGSGQFEGKFWIAMELIEGACLHTLIQHQNGLHPELTARLMGAVLGALGEMHSKGFYHRDVKPGNILVENTGRAVLMDLGLAKHQHGKKLTQTGHVLGTPLYLPVDVLRGESFDAGVDFYALGLTWWECLTTQRPYEFQTLVENAADDIEPVIPAPWSPHGEIAPRHLHLIQELCAPRSRRPRSIQEVNQIARGQGPVDDRTKTFTQELSLEETQTIQELLQASATETGNTSNTGHTSNTEPVAASLPQPSPPVGSPPRKPTSLRYVVFLAPLLFLFGAAVWLYLPAKSPQEIPPAKVDPSAWKLLADFHSAVFLATPTDPQALRARRVHKTHTTPLPVFRLSSGQVAIWVTGLYPGEKGQVEVFSEKRDSSRETLSFEVPRFVKDLKEGSRFPSVLRRMNYRRNDKVLGRQVEAMRKIVDQEEFIRSELELTYQLSVFTDFSDRLWPTFLSWLEEPSSFLGPNLMRCLKFASPSIPPQVAWHLWHRMADSQFLLSRELNTEVDFDPFQGLLPPPELYDRLAEWKKTASNPRGVFRLAVRIGKRLTEAARIKPFPRSISDWSEPLENQEAVAPQESLPATSLGSLFRLALEAKRGHAKSQKQLIERSKDPSHPDHLWALCLLPVSGDRSVIPWLISRFKVSEGEEFEAVEAALWGFRTVRGFWTATNQQILSRSLFQEFVVEEIEVDGDHPVAWHPVDGVLYAWVPGTGVKVTLKGEGQSRKFLVSAKAVKPLDE